MSEKIYTLNEIKDILLKVAPEYDVEKIYIFGSYARGEAKAKSDLDFYVENFNFLPFHSIFNFIGRMEIEFKKQVDVITNTSEQYIKDQFDKDLFNSIKKERILCYERK